MSNCPDMQSRLDTKKCSARPVLCLFTGPPVVGLTPVDPAAVGHLLTWASISPPVATGRQLPFCVAWVGEVPLAFAFFPGLIHGLGDPCVIRAILVGLRAVPPAGLVLSLLGFAQVLLPVLAGALLPDPFAIARPVVGFSVLDLEGGGEGSN